MYKTKAVRDKKGRVVYEAFQSKDTSHNTRIQPDRRWFGNTRVIGQKQLDQFREEMSEKVNDAYTVLLREKKLPLSLIEDPDKEAKAKGKEARANLLTHTPFSETFGPGARRKRPRLALDSYESLVARAADTQQDYEERQGTRPDGHDRSRAWDAAEYTEQRGLMFNKGQSRRIWGELYKVVDSSDVVVEVLDARDPEGTRCRFLEQHLKRNHRQKHLVLLLNKCDLVPAWVTRLWLQALSREFPVLAFHASVTNPFGKGALLSVLRQMARLRQDKPAISVGFVGYPNVGKSSVINALRQKAVCKTAPVPGETKVWQFITLMKRVFLIDCPGVVYNKTRDSEADSVLKGVVRVENLEDATEFIEEVLGRVKPRYVRRAYQIRDWTDAEDFLDQLARRQGKLLKGGEPDLNTVAKGVLYDWQRGRLPFFSLPPGAEEAVRLAREAAEEEQEAERQERAEAGAGEAAAEEGASEDGSDPEEEGAEGKLEAAERAAVAKGLARANRQQRKGDIPQAHGFFDGDDLEAPGGSGSEEEEESGEEDDGDSGSEEGDGEDSDEEGGELGWEDLMKEMKGKK
ncbi:unnamed protein product [Pedinophyceae sp. YPF-701]|nr:unnamed protein product [Pedinophyceae sp. YPF-701]